MLDLKRWTNNREKMMEEIRCEEYDFNNYWNDTCSCRGDSYSFVNNLKSPKEESHGFFKMLPLKSIVVPIC